MGPDVLVSRKAARLGGRYRVVMRQRLVLLVLALGVTLAGLASRRYGPQLPWFVAAYAGDVLYAVLVFVLIRMVTPRATGVRVAAAAVGICFLIEFSQLIRTPAFDALRATLPGRLILGRGFVWSDLACYAVGVAGAWGLDAVLRGRTHVEPAPA